MSGPFVLPGKVPRMPEKMVRETQVDALMASLATTQSSAFRTALNGLLPKAGTTIPSGLTQSVVQRSDGTWPNPVRDATAGIRIYASISGQPVAPTYVDGLRVGDWWVTSAGLRIASVVPQSTAVAPSWMNVAATPTTGGGGTTTPTDPGTTNPPAGDTSTPSPTSRPYAMLGSTGVWTTNAGTTLVQALSDQAVSSATGAPAAGSQGVSLTLDMGNFQHALGNDLNVTLWGAQSTTAGDVTVSIGYGGATYAAAATKQVTGTATSLAFVWPADSQPVLPTSAWRDVEVTVRRATGGLTLVDLTLQSLPPTVTPPAGTDTSDPATLRWGNSSVWYSRVGSAPLAKANAAVAAYVKAQASSGAFRLDVYSDSDPIWVVPGSTPRVNVTPLASTRGAATLMHTTDGKGALDAVPIPGNAPAPSNMFKTAVVMCLDTQQVWEFIGLTKTGTTWSAEWGGRIDNVNTSSGAFPAGAGYTGSGLSWTAAAVKVSEAKKAAAGDTAAIDHAIGLNLNYDSASTKWCWPATRSDGTSADAGAPQMGQRLRLKSSFNVDGSALTPLGKAVAKAMQTFGAVVMGGADKISILAESGASEQAKTGVDPWGAILNGRTVDTILAGIPLDQLEVVSPGWGSPTWVAETDPVIVVPPTTPTTPTSGSAAMRILGPSRSGLPWHSGVKADGPYSTAMVEKFGSWRGRPVDGGLTYPEYSNNGSATMQSIEGSGWCATLYNGFPGRIYYGFAPFAASLRGSADDNGGLWRRLANGEFDATIDAQASYLVNNGRGNSIIRVAWEWNGDWYVWRCGYGGASAFRDGFRRIVQRMRAKSPNFKFCFEVNGFTSLRGKSGDSLAPYSYPYPGDDVVDLIGSDMYQFNSEGSPDGNFSRYLRGNNTRGPGLDDTIDFARAHGKGVALFEWGIHGTDGYGDRADFIQGMWDWLVKNKDIVAVESYFNEFEDYIKNSLYNSQTGAIQNPKAAAKYKELWGKGL